MLYRSGAWKASSEEVRAVISIIYEGYDIIGGRGKACHNDNNDNNDNW